MVFFFCKWVIRKLLKSSFPTVHHIFLLRLWCQAHLTYCSVKTYHFIKENHVWSWSRVNSCYLGNKYNFYYHYCVLYFKWGIVSISIVGWDGNIVNNAINLWNSLYGKSAFNNWATGIYTAKQNWEDEVLYNSIRIMNTTGEGNWLLSTSTALCLI